MPEAWQKNGYVQANRPAWSSHIARAHGKIHAPLAPKKSTYYYICKGCFMARGVNSHLTLKHVREGQFKQPFLCLECQRQGINEGRIDGLDA